jgi:hypothetical protein
MAEQIITPELKKFLTTVINTMKVGKVDEARVMLEDKIGIPKDQQGAAANG